MNIPRIFAAAFLAAVVTTICLSAERLSAQSIPPVPAPTPGTPAAQADPSAEITMDDGTAVSVKARGGRVQRVLLRADQRATVTLRYGTSYAGLAVTVAALDGGTVRFPDSHLIAPDGTFALQFSGARQPGLYRVFVNCGGAASTWQFWVPEPGASAVDASILVPLPASSK